MTSVSGTFKFDPKFNCSGRIWQHWTAKVLFTHAILESDFTGWCNLDMNNPNQVLPHFYPMSKMLHSIVFLDSRESPEAVFLVVCDPSMNELWATWTHRDLCIDLSRSLIAHSQKGRTRLKIRALSFLIVMLSNLSKTFSGQTPDYEIAHVNQPF